MDSEVGQAITRRLLLARKAAKLTQADAAQEIGVGRQTLSKWERGRSAPNPAQLSRLCMAYGITPTYMLFGLVDIPDVYRAAVQKAAAGPPSED